MDPYRDTDCLIFVTGRKSVGKSVFSIALAEQIACEISKITHKPPSEYFTIKNVRSVDRHGSMEILTSDVLTKENGIIIIDDAQISYGARSAMTRENKAMGDILTIMRPYRVTLIINCVYSSTVDKIARSLADFIIPIISSSTLTKQTIAKVYFSEITESGKEYKKFLTWKGKRIKYWINTLPNPELMKAYKKLRKENTDKFVAETYDKFVKEPEAPNGRKNGVEQFIQEHGEAIRADYKETQSIRALSRKYGVSEYRIGRCLTEAS